MKVRAVKMSDPKVMASAYERSLPPESRDLLEADFTALVDRIEALEAENRRLKSGPEAVQDDVTSFHAKMGLPSRRADRKLPKLADEWLRLRLISEEFYELVVALSRDDIEGAVDAVVDSIYVLLGSLDRWGVEFKPVWEEIQRTNMAKEPGNTEGGKLQKPDDWEPPNIKQAIKAGVQERDRKPVEK